MRPADVFGPPRAPLWAPARWRLGPLLIAAAMGTLLALLIGTATQR